MATKFSSYLALVLLMLAVSCGNSRLSFDASTAPRVSADLDHDGVPNDIEARLGTDSRQIDTDRDGISDQYELWGLNGTPIGQTGPLTDLPDANGNGQIAALDPTEAGGATLSGRAVRALEDKRLRVIAPGGPAIENDLDGDYIPSDFELEGFYYEIDQQTGEDWFVKWDGDPNRAYFKTDPTKWSSDADPWSDWEEATKRNLDQRLKHPGDHPCIPAYPDIQAVLVSYSIEDASKIETTTGRAAEKGWKNTVSSKDTVKTDWSVTGTVSVENESKFNFNEGKFSSTTKATVKVAGHTGSSTENESHVAAENSGLTRDEWQFAIAGDTINTAKILLDLKLLNVGTLPANNARVLFNLKVGDFIIDSFLVLLTSENGYGELEALGQNPVDYVVSNNGKGNIYVPAKDLFISMQQLRALQLGAPLSIEMVSFEAQTVVGEFDAATGRRINLNIGPWSPYQSALENSSARLLLDLGDEATQPAALPGEIAPRRTKEIRVFAYDNTSNYIGSPPVVTLQDAFVWGFGAQATQFGPAVTLTDPVTHQKRSEFLQNFLFGFDEQTMRELIAGQLLADGVGGIPLRPSNPTERVYIATAPPLVVAGDTSRDETRPRVVSATLLPYRQERREVFRPVPPPDQNDPAYATYDPDNPPKVLDHYAFIPVLDPVVRVYAYDRQLVTGVRFVPYAGSLGELMTYRSDPNHPEDGGAWEYRVPLNYKWTGFEQVIALNRRGEASDPFTITAQELSYFDEQGNLVAGEGGRDPFGGGFHTKYVIKLDNGNLVKDANGAYVEEPDTANLYDFCNDFVVQGAQVGDTVLNLKTGKSATIATLSEHKLGLSWIGVPAVGDRSAWAFKYLQPYAILNAGARHFDTLGYRKFSVRSYSNALWPANTQPERLFGLNLSDPAALSVAPYDIKIKDNYTAAAYDQVITIDKAIGVALVGGGDFDHWDYESLRKLSFSATPFVIDSATRDSTFAVLLKNDCIAKIKFVLPANTADPQRFQAVDVEIYQGI